MAPMPGTMPSVISGSCIQASFTRDDAVAAHRELQPAAQRHAVQRGDHRLLHGVEVHQQARAVARVLRRRVGVAEHGGEAADVGAGAEGPRAVAGEDEALHGGRPRICG
jgi:hypothetical protein